MYTISNSLDNISFDLDDLDPERYHRIEPYIYIARHGTSSSLPWTTNITGTTVPEFETYPTVSNLFWAKLVDSFATNLAAAGKGHLLQILQHSQLFRHLRSGSLLNELTYHLDQGTSYQDVFEIIQKELIKTIRNHRSLICRVGRTIFTGDATSDQLQEALQPLKNRRSQLGGEISIKLNHHGSCVRRYIYHDFYKELNPTTLLLKRDDRVESAVGFNSNLQTTLVRAGNPHLIDSVNIKKNKNGKWFRTYD